MVNRMGQVLGLDERGMEIAAIAPVGEGVAGQEVKPVSDNGLSVSTLGYFNDVDLSHDHCLLVELILFEVDEVVEAGRVDLIELSRGKEAGSRCQAAFVSAVKDMPL